MDTFLFTPFTKNSKGVFGWEKYYQYQFKIASQGGKRKWKTKSGFLNRASAYDAGCIAYNEYT